MEAIWDELNEDMLNPLVQKALDSGRAAVGYTCSFAPIPLLSVGRLFPVAMRAPGASTTELADVYLSSVICAYTRSLQEFHMQGSYYWMGGWVIPCACDHIRRLNDHLDMLKTPEDTYFNFEVVRDPNEFKQRCDIIVANRRTSGIADVEDKVYTRDLFGSD